jgi:hypothetical protein
MQYLEILPENIHNTGGFFLVPVGIVELESKGNVKARRR